MLTYWLMFLVPAIVSIASEGERMPGSFGEPRTLQLDFVWLIVASVLGILIGFRWEVGGDWGNYYRYLEMVAGFDLQELATMGEPGYMLLNWISLEGGWDLVGVNVMCGAIFAACLVIFCLNLPRPWMAMAIAVPYLIIVVAMGYSRQGVALGLGMLGFVALARGSNIWFVVWIVLGATFHKSAIFLLPVAALANAKNKVVALAWGGLASVVGYATLLEDSMDTLVTNYIDAQYQSSGAFIRLAMNAVPAVILLWMRKDFPLPKLERPLWNLYALLALALFAVFFVSPSSTAVDRVGLYLLPLQMVVFARLPDALANRNICDRGMAVAAGLLYYAAVEFVWLNYADHSEFWIPYRSYLLEELL